MKPIQYFLSLLPLLFCFFLPGNAETESNEAPKSNVAVVDNKGGKVELYDEYQSARNSYLADGGIMLHEELTTRHFAVKVKKNGAIRYCGMISNGEKVAKVNMESKSEDDQRWSGMMTDAAKRVGMSNAEIRGEGF